jgi:hypothetical protein
MNAGVSSSLTGTRCSPSIRRALSCKRFRFRCSSSNPSIFIFSIFCPSALVYFFFFGRGALWESALPAAVFDAWLVRRSRRTFEAAFAAFAPVRLPFAPIVQRSFPRLPRALCLGLLSTIVLLQESNDVSIVTPSCFCFKWRTLLYM